jgi:hypothetical protein
MTRPRERRKRWHWIITIAFRDSGGTDRMVTSEGTCAPLPGATRQEMFNLVYNRTVKQAEATDAFVLLFSLEPDDLWPATEE